jgi:O-antigen/teichoic acid export membrane protein
MILVSLTIWCLPLLIEGFVFKPAYVQAIAFIPYGVLIYLFKPMRLYLSIPYGILKHTKSLPVIYFLVASIKIILMVSLIDRIGIYGVIFASLVTLGLEMWMLYYSGRARFHFTFNVYKLLLSPLLILLIILLTEPIVGIKYPYAAHSAYVVVCMAVLLWAFRNEVKLIDPLKILRSR